MVHVPLRPKRATCLHILQKLDSIGSTAVCAVLFGASISPDSLHHTRVTELTCAQLTVKHLHAAGMEGERRTGQRGKQDSITLYLLVHDYSHGLNCCRFTHQLRIGTSSMYIVGCPAQGRHSQGSHEKRACLLFDNVLY